MPFFNYKIIFLILILTVTSCGYKQKDNSESQSNFKEWTIPLENNLGDITISLPNHLDTFFKWTQYSDCGDPCASTNYRMQPKNLPIYKESGFYFETVKDSVEQLTIKHAKLAMTNTTPDSLVIKHSAEKLKTEVFEIQPGQFQIDTLVIINQKMFYVLAYSLSDKANGTSIHKLFAITSIKGNAVEFNFESRKKESGAISKDIIQDSFAALQTVQVND